MELGQRRRDDDRQADLAEIVKLTLTFVRAAVLKRAQLEVDLVPSPPVKGSPNKLGQVMTNLLVNAMQALPDRARSENRIKVTLGPDSSEGWVRVVVSDNGEGIPESVRDRIFDPFFTTKTQGGTGLGLAISKRIVEELGGHIDVDSSPGGGTTFLVRLPAATTGVTHS